MLITLQNADWCKADIQELSYHTQMESDNKRSINYSRRLALEG